MRAQIILSAALAICASQSAIGQDTSAIENQLRQKTNSFVQLFNEHDASGLAEFYSEDCDVVHVGRPIPGRQAMRAALTENFIKNRYVMTSTSDVSYRVLSPQLAVESGKWTETGRSKGDATTQGSYTCVYQKRAGGWEIVHERAWTKDGDTPDTPVVTLKGAVPELGTYLHGSWKVSGKNDGKQISGRMTVSPSANGRSQIYEWTVEKEEGISHGSAIGGVDPATGSVVEFGFSGGNHWVNRYEDGTPLTGVGKTTGVRNGVKDGKLFTGEITVNRTSMDRFEYQVESEGEISIDYVFERTAGKASDETVD